MARLWRRRGVSSSDIRETVPAVVEAAPKRQPIFVAPPASAVRRRGYDSDVPRSGTGPKQQSTATTLNRRDLMDQLYGAYLTCPWSSACVDAVARTVTAGGLHIVSDDDTKERTAPAGRALPKQAQQLQRLLDFVNPREDIRQLLRGVLVDLQVTGDAFIEVVWLLGLPVALYSLDSATMVPIADEHGDISGYVQEVDADRHADFKPHEVIHISMDSPRGGVYGVGPTQKLMVPITSWLFTAGLVKETMRKGNPPWLHVDWPTEAEYSEMERFDDQYAVRNLGAANIGNPILSHGGATANELKAAQIAEYLATLNQRRDEILSGYGVPPSKVGVIESGNLGGGTGTEQDKALDLSTRIPTPSGWTTMGELRIGDSVFDEAGRPCTVIGTYEVPFARSWRLFFSDGTSIDCCEDHLWTTWTAADRKAYGRAASRAGAVPEDWPTWRSRRGLGPQTRRTADMLSTLRVGERANHSIPLAAPLRLDDAALPVDPYVLGAWLGDGTSVNGSLTCGVGDEQIIKEIVAAGYSVTERPSARRSGRTPSYNVTGLITQLRALGVLGNKHVPAPYLRGSVDQRLALLQGLMDTDGGFSSGQQVLFRATNEALADAVVELARSLGQRPVKAKGTARLNGVDCGAQYAVTWTPTIPVFRLARKADRWDPPVTLPMVLAHRYVVDAVKIPDRPMRCIRVDSPNAMYLAGDGMIPTHNTYRVNTCGPLGEIVLEKWNFALLDAFGVEGWKLEFGEVDWRDDVVVENIRQMRLKSGVWTWNRYREEIDEPPIEGGDNPIIIERQLIMSVSDVAAFSTATVAATAAAAAGSGTPPTADGDAEDPQAAADGSKATKELPAGQKPPSGAAGQSGTSGKAAGGKDSASPSAAAAASKASTSAPAGKSAKESEDIAGWLAEYHARRREALLELVGESEHTNTPEAQR